MSKPNFKIAITRDFVNYFTVNGRIVSTAPAITYVESSLVDWETITINYKRDMLQFGIMRGYSPDRVRFAEDGAKILRHIKANFGGRTAVAYLCVYMLNSYTQLYEYDSNWQFDFSEDENYELFYDIAIMQGGLTGLIKTFGDSNYDIPLNDPKLAPDFPLYNPLPINALPLTPPVNNPVPPAVPKLVLMDGIPIKGRLDYITTDIDEGIDMNAGPDTGSTAAALVVMSLLYTNTLGDYTVGRTNNSIEDKRAGIDAIADTATFIQNKGMSSRMRIAYNLRNFKYGIFVTPGNFVKLRLRYAVYAGSPTSSTTWGALLSSGIIYEDPVGVTMPSSGLTFRSPELNWKGMSDTIDMPPNSILAIGFSYSMVGPVVGGENVGVTIPAYTITPATIPLPAISLHYTFVPDSSVCRALSWGQMFDQLVRHTFTNGGLLPNIYGTRSNLLNTFRSLFAPGNWDLNPQCTFFTCGDSLRGLKTVTIADPYYNGGLPFDSYLVPAINTNLRDFTKDLLSDLCAGIGIENDTVVCEELSYFFDDDTVIADLGTGIEHDSFEMSNFKEFVGSSLQFGQSDQQFDSINGPLETISEVEMSTPLDKTRNTIDYKSPYRHDPYGIELTRANIGNKTNINSSSDNDTFKLHTTGVEETLVPVLGNWAGLSGYETEIKALLLMRATNVKSGLPFDLLTPEVNPYAMYNLSFSPQRKARRMLPWLCSNYRGLVNKMLGISSHKKNIRLVSNLGSGDIAESDYINVDAAAQTYTPPFATTPVTVAPAPIPAGKTTALIYKPIQFSFRGPAIKGLTKLMTPPGTVGGGKMYGKIKFTFVRGGIKYPLAGFVLDVGMNPAKDAIYTYELLCSPTVDLPDTL